MQAKQDSMTTDFTERGLCVFRESWRDILRVRTLFILYPYDSFLIINLLLYSQSEVYPGLPSAFYHQSAVCSLRFAETVMKANPHIVRLIVNSLGRNYFPFT